MKKTIITIVTLIVLLTVVLYGYEFILKKPVIEAPAQLVVEDMVTTPIEVKEQYKNSTYTFVGSVQVPTPCHTLTSKVNMLSANAYEIEVTTLPPKEGVMCAQVIADKSFKVNFKAAQNITITAKIDGVIYDTNRFLIPSEENIDTYNIEIKG